MADTTNQADDSGYDLLKEDCMSFSKAARRLPKVRGKKHPAPETIGRWAHHGRLSRSGEIVHLEYIKIGGTNCTSMEALGRFFARLRGDDLPGKPCTARRLDPPKTPGVSNQNSPEKRAEQATEILRRRGIVK